MENELSEHLPSSAQRSSTPPSPALPSSGSSRPRRPPTVTPRRFNKFFNPRSGSNALSSSAGRQLRDVTFNGANSQSPANVTDEFPSPRHSKRQRRDSYTYGDDALLPDLPSSLPSSPLRNISSRPTIRQPFPSPIRRAMSTTVPICQTADFVSGPNDRRCDTGSGITFCTAACNTNSLFATGTEQGRILILDSDKKTNLREDAPWLSMHHHINAITDLAFSSDDNYLISGSGDSKVKVTDMHTQQVVHDFKHSSSLKQVQFQPGNDKILAVCGRDSKVSIWDLRSPKPMYRISIEAARSYENGRTSKIGSLQANEKSRSSVTSMQFLPQGREHLFATSSDSSARLMLWDIRSGQLPRTASTVPLAISAPVPHHSYNRHYGVNWLSLSTDGSRLYSLCRDGTVYAYSTNHFILGQAPELSQTTSRARRYQSHYAGIGPLYGFKHTKLHVSTFYVRCAIRKATPEHPELLAVGSSGCSPVLFPTDESIFARRLRTPSQEASRPRTLAVSHTAYSKGISPAIPILEHGTALVRGHESEVTSVAWTPRGELISVADDFVTRCWREDADGARDIRTAGEPGGSHRWAWAEVDEDWDEDDG